MPVEMDDVRKLVGAVPSEQLPGVAAQILSEEQIESIRKGRSTVSADAWKSTLVVTIAFMTEGNDEAAMEQLRNLVEE